jgi:hypothetical protein
MARMSGGPVAWHAERNRGIQTALELNLVLAHPNASPNVPLSGKAGPGLTLHGAVGDFRNNVATMPKGRRSWFGLGLSARHEE